MKACTCYDQIKYVARRNREFPLIPITLIKENVEIDTDALIDSGANISVFREEIAECLEIVIEDRDGILLQGPGGRIVGYIHGLKVRVDDEEFPCKVVFSKELYIGCRNKKVLTETVKFLEQYKVVHFSSSISRKTLELISEYNLSHGLLIAYAIIAATVLISEGELFSNPPQADVL